jgi:perosamine synthetase
VDPHDVKKKIAKKRKAIMEVHIYGHPCEMGKLVTIEKENKLILVEDCAEGIGPRYEGKYL